MWVTECIFLHSSTFYHVNLGKSQFSCLDMSFTKVGTKFVKKKVFKLNVEIFHQRQPNCKLDSYERATKKENSTISSWDWGRYRSEEMAPNSWGLYSYSITYPSQKHVFFKLSLTYRGFASFHSQHLLVDRGYLICWAGDHVHGVQVNKTHPLQPVQTWSVVSERTSRVWTISPIFWYCTVIFQIGTFHFQYWKGKQLPANQPVLVHGIPQYELTFGWL